jgi:hypothetical protein
VLIQGEILCKKYGVLNRGLYYNKPIGQGFSMDDFEFRDGFDPDIFLWNLQVAGI